MTTSYTTYYQSPIGKIKISGNDTYISEMVFVEESEPASMLEAGHGPLPHLLREATEQLIQYFQGVRRVFDLPVNQTGTLFQQKVWQELMNISYGRTISYLEMSHRLGNPKVIRPAASANGKNNLCIIIPCHRVIGSNQELVGYTGGLWRKKSLLSLENKIANGVQTLF